MFHSTSTRGIFKSPFNFISSRVIISYFSHNNYDCVICAMIPDCLWKEFHLLPDEGDDTDEQYVWQENCDFDTSNNAVAHRQQFILDNNPHNVSSMREWCASHCLNNPCCVHFNVDKNKNCFVLTNTSPLIERMAVEGGACGYFFDRPNIWTYNMMKR